MKCIVIAGLLAALAGCSSRDEEAERKAALEHADQVAADAEAQLQKDEAELRKNMRMLLNAMQKPCDRVQSFEQASDTRVDITCSYDGRTLRYVLDKTTNTVEER